MDRAEKMDCRENGEVIFIGVTTEFQLKKGLIPEENEKIEFDAHELVKQLSAFRSSLREG